VGLYFWGLTRVPFHPDESNWIYMSGDFDLVARSGLAPLVWARHQPLTDDEFLRLINAPLPKYVIGAGRWLSDRGRDRNANWDWTASWEENERAGALPSTEALVAARRAVALAAVLSLLLLFWVGCEVVGFGAAAVGTLLLATHPLLMLHTRRAMAEGVAQLFSILAIYGIVRFVEVAEGLRFRRWQPAALVAGAGVGLAIAAKQNAAVLMGVALTAAGLVALSADRAPWARLRAGLGVAGVLLVATVVTYFLLNPVLYQQPVRGARSMLSIRMALAANQARMTEAIAPGTVTPTVPSRLSAAWRELYWNPAAFSEWPNYDGRIAQAVASYENEPIGRVWNSRWTRWLFLLLSACGLASAVRAAIRDKPGRRSRGLQILLAWFVLETSFVTTFVSVDWQRYFLPLFPPVCLLAGLGLSQLWRTLTKGAASDGTGRRDP
jgi:4-amino-4-deoxy-L-arabinose transferase-like glycosyltransferase